jgi:hypothetical protein
MRPSFNLARLSGTGHCWAFTFLMLLNVDSASAQTKKDTTIILISDISIQLEAAQALNDLYDFKFEQAERQIRWFKQKYAWHPLPYFMLGLSEWWKIMPNTKETKYDDRFLAYMDSAIMVAENLYKKHPEYKVEASFFLAASHGFKGRLYSDEERKNWRKAAVQGKIALGYLEECRGKEYLSPELQFGDALYNYFSVWVPENYPALKPVLWFLREVSYNAFYTRTEAMVWYMRIMNNYENDQPKAYQVAEYLYQTYPNNPYFHRYYARMLYSRGMYPELEKQSKRILDLIDSAKFGYEATSGRYAAFFLGQMYDFQRKWEEAKKYYLLSIKYAEQIEATESGYYLYSLIALGEINERQGNKTEAKKYFTLVKKKAKRKDEAYKDAKRRLKKIDSKD